MIACGSSWIRIGLTAISKRDYDSGLKLKGKYMNRAIVYDWLVIGAGPAGIAAVGNLIDQGVDPQSIIWLDPEFKVGDFARKWSQVPSNTKVKLFMRFLHACQAFHFSKRPDSFAIESFDPEQTCELKWMAQPLQWISQQLQQQVDWQSTYVQALNYQQRLWQVKTQHGELLAKHVILAIGSEPKTLHYPSLASIPLATAFDRSALAAACNPDETIAVFGGSHSAILIIRQLLEQTAVANVINFYQSPLCFAIDLGDQILFDDSGLKGSTAQWAKANLSAEPLPERLIRVKATDHNLQTYLTQCSKAIYAIGFKPRQLMIDGCNSCTYNPQTGEIATQLYGIGIAFPEAKINHLGKLEYRVGLWKFMDYLKRIIPQWLTQTATARLDNILS